MVVGGGGGGVFETRKELHLEEVFRE